MAFLNFRLIFSYNVHYVYVLREMLLSRIMERIVDATNKPNKAISLIGLNCKANNSPLLFHAMSSFLSSSTTENAISLLLSLL